MYIPKPINTDDIVLPADIAELVEQLAKNVHDEWAKQRMKEGWIYGEKKDSTLKTTPCLVEYEKLSEEEKEYDRITAMKTLKLIMKLGFVIKKER